MHTHVHLLLLGCWSQRACPPVLRPSRAQASLEGSRQFLLQGSSQQQRASPPLVHPPPPHPIPRMSVNLGLQPRVRPVDGPMIVKEVRTHATSVGWRVCVSPAPTHLTHLTLTPTPRSART